MKQIIMWIPEITEPATINLGNGYYQHQVGEPVDSEEKAREIEQQAALNKKLDWLHAHIRDLILYYDQIMALLPDQPKDTP
jgi:hypothetical protein